LMKQSLVKTYFDEINFGGGQGDAVNLGSYRDVVFTHNLDKKIKIQLQWDGNYDEQIELSHVDDDVIIDMDDRQIDVWIDLILNNDGIHYIGPLRQHPQRSYLWSGASPRQIEPNGENTIAALIASERSDDDLHLQVAEWLVKMELVDGFS